MESLTSHGRADLLLSGEMSLPCRHSQGVCLSSLLYESKIIIKDTLTGFELSCLPEPQWRKTNQYVIFTQSPTLACGYPVFSQVFVTQHSPPSTHPQKRQTSPVIRKKRKKKSPSLSYKFHNFDFVFRHVLLLNTLHTTNS